MLKIPYIGWSKLKPLASKKDWKNTILKETEEEDSLYFVHSFAAFTNNENILSYYDFYGSKITALYSKERVMI